MASLESKLFYALLRLLGKKKFLEMQFAFGWFDFGNSKEPPRRVHRRCHVTRHVVDGRAVFTLAPRGQAADLHIFYLHGGAYIQNFVRQHWTFLLFLVEETRCTITAPDYPLAPTHTQADAFAMVVPLYHAWRAQAGPGRTVLMGDSAGGGFALALAQHIRGQGGRQPHHIMLLSPWLDVTLTNPGIAALDADDPFLGIPGLQKAGLAYAGSTALTDYHVSPFYGPLEGLGELSLFMGSRDILAADARALARRAAAEGIALRYREYPNMVHVWMLLSFPESKAARREIIARMTG